MLREIRFVSVLERLRVNRERYGRFESPGVKSPRGRGWIAIVGRRIYPLSAPGRHDRFPGYGKCQARGT